MNCFPNSLIFLLFLFLFSQVSKTYDTISVEEFGSHAGFYPIPRTKAAKMFYFFFESQTNISDPVVIWLSGGPGCSSNLALFYENGPVRISEDHSLTRAEYSWNKVSNLIFVDQPLGTGFSTISDTSDIPHDENDINLNEGLACDSAYEACLDIFSKIMSKNKGMNYYDLRKKRLGEDSYDFSRMNFFLNQVNVRKTLGDAEFFLHIDTVYDALQSDWMRNLEVKIPALVEDGNARWVDQMNWTGHKDFVSAKTFPFLVDKKAGLVKSFGPLTFIKVYNAGHMVPMDQSKVSLQMLQNWMHGKLGITTT